MDYSNEPWIKVYTRDTASWCCASLAARGLALELSRKMGRFCDEISLGARGLRAVAGLVNAPWPEVEPLLEELLADGRLVYDPERQVLRDPSHADRQTAASSDAQRKRDERAQKASRKVTPRHDTSREVTPRHDQREEKEEIEERETRAREDVADAPEAETGEAVPLSPPTDEEPEGEPSLPDDTPPPLDARCPPQWTAVGQGIIARTGVVDVELEPTWRKYVAWLNEPTNLQPASEARWTRWMYDECSAAAKARKRADEREWSRPRLVTSRSLFAKAPPDVRAPYHAAAAARPDDGPKVSPEAARADLERLFGAVGS